MQTSTLPSNAVTSFRLISLTSPSAQLKKGVSGATYVKQTQQSSCRMWFQRAWKRDSVNTGLNYWTELLDYTGTDLNITNLTLEIIYNLPVRLESNSLDCAAHD